MSAHETDEATHNPTPSSRLNDAGDEVREHSNSCDVFFPCRTMSLFAMLATGQTAGIDPI
jgi:hypothetical protein